MARKKKGKKKPKKAFMTDEDLEMEEELRKKAELERVEKENMLKELEAELRRAKKQKKKRDENEMEEERYRTEVLERHCSDFETLNQEHFNYLLEVRREKEWENYVNCQHRPFANDPPALNTFLYTWKDKKDEVDLDNVLSVMEEILGNIQPTEEYINCPLDLPKKVIDNLREVTSNYHNQIMDLINHATLRAIKNYRKYYNVISPFEVDYFKESKNFSILLWCWFIGCDRDERTTDDQNKKEKIFKITPNLTVTLPEVVELNRHHLRIFHTSYDPFSNLVSSFNLPTIEKDLNILEESELLRKLKIEDLKNHYKGDYDEDVMPWWFVADEEVQAEKKKRELEKEMKPVKKKNFGFVSNYAVSDPSPKNTLMVAEPPKIDKKAEDEIKMKKEEEEIKKKKEDDEIKKKKEEEDIKKKKEEEEIKKKKEEEEEINKCLPHTPILYSRSMTDLMEAKKNECRGPVYYPEVDPINFLGDPDMGNIPSEIYREVEQEGELLRTEKNTLFRACFHHEVIGGNLEMLKETNKAFNDNEIYLNDVEFANEREFLDWKSFRELSPDRDAMREELEELMFGDNTVDVEDGKMKFVKRDPRLRSIKELFSELVNRERKSTNKTSLGIDSPIIAARSVSRHPLKLSNVSAMKDMQLEISNIIESRLHGYFNEYSNKLAVHTEIAAINLRQYSIYGGVYHFDFFETALQPVVNKDDVKMHLHYGDHVLRPVKFDQVPKVRIDLAIEVERKFSLAQRQRSLRKSSRMGKISFVEDFDEFEYAQADDDLVSFALKVPNDIIYFESPIPVRWSMKRRNWTTDDIYDSRWSAKTRILNFKMGKSKPFALAVFRFCSLPFHSYHLKPSSDWKNDPAVILTLETRHFTITLGTKEDKVKIEDFIYPEKNSVEHLIGVPMTVSELVMNLKKTGIDIFPDWDSYLYINTRLTKLKSLELHMYSTISKVSPSYEFKSSINNTLSRSDRIYLELKECDYYEPSGDFSTLIVEPRKVSYLGESGYSTKEGGQETVEYTPDLMNLIEKTASKRSLKRIKNASKITMGTLTELLGAVKILSYA